jgi:dTDP-4-amino-4,6-dideoxygalactose transaminase
VDFNDVRFQYESLRDEIDAAIGSTLRSGRYILAPAVHAFEEQFARYIKPASGIAVASGTDANTKGLRAIGV